MKKEVLFIVLILLISMPFLIADEVDDKVNKAYSCLTGRVNESCASLSPEEKIFSLLAVEECKDYVINSSTNLQHWSSSLKLTSQAVLALDNINVNVTAATNWLLLQNAVPSDIDWYLEVEGSGATTCTIVYDSTSYPITIGTDKKINTAAGSCLSLSASPYANYWLKISSTCYNKSFDVSCNNSFLTTLLYKKSTSPIIYVSDKTSSASAGGTTTEKVDFSCFKQGSTCNYEGSLWAAFVLDHVGEDISSYKPYLITMAEDNQQYIPESFLYLIDSSDTNLRTILLSKQQNNKWWSASGNPYYDTSLALLPFQNENPTEKTNSKNWLLDSQDSQGCWQGNIRDTAFILYSIWPEYFTRSSSTSGTEGSIDGTDSSTCEDIEGYCIFEANCADIEGSELSAYSFSCNGEKICCDTSPASQTCSEVGGEICVSDEICSISNIETLDTYDCCTGYCEESVTIPESECESDGGTCRNSCASSEEENSNECDYVGEVCCEDKPIGISGGGSKSYWWIWVLLILIILVVLGIIFRDKLSPLWFRLKSKFKRKPKTPPGFSQSRAPMGRPIHRRPLPSRRPAPRTRSEVDDVLKKLKEIGK